MIWEALVSSGAVCNREGQLAGMTSLGEGEFMRQAVPANRGGDDGEDDQEVIEEGSLRQMFMDESNKIGTHRQAGWWWLEPKVCGVLVVDIQPSG